MGKGVTFEGYVITQELYDSQGRNDKFIPVVFSVTDREGIPTLLRGSTSYNISNTDEYNELYWGAFLGQPKVTIPEIGPARDRPGGGLSQLATSKPSAALSRLEAVRDFGPRPPGQYCNRCGAVVGEPTRCPGYTNHNFVRGR